MTVADELLALGEPIWTAQAEHPFVRGIGDGSLPEAAFRRWLIQDYRYLVEFARAFAWAAARADRLESMRSYAEILHLTLDTEMDLHRRIAGRFGLTPQQLEDAPAWPTTRAYADFLVRTAAAGELAHLLAATLPCAWEYVHIARRLAEGPAPKDRRYADWIAQYASDDLAEAARRLGRELDRLAEGADEDRRRRLREVFLTSCAYQRRFWDMCWHGESWEVASGRPQAADTAADES